MRKLLAILLCTMLLCGCSSDDTPATEATPGPDSITITENYTLVAPKDATIMQAAESIQTTLVYKLWVPVTKIATEDPGSNAVVFQVDDTMEAGAHKVELKGSSIYVTAQTPHILMQITRQLRQMIIDSNTPEVTKQMCEQLTGKTDMSTLPFRFLSQNILFKDVEGGNSVLDRKPRFKALMQEYCPDILAVQEHSDSWGSYITMEFGKIYTDYATQSLAFYFRTDRYEILETGAFYLSPTPNEPSQFEGDSGPRSCIWAIAKDKFTGITTLYINCHPDWNNDTQRALQVDVIFQVMGEKMKQYPTIFCGDFNTEPTGPVYPRIVQDFKDSYKEAEINLSEIDYTCHSFGKMAIFIDYTFYNHTFKPTYYRIINDMYDGYISDHYGTFTDFALDQ